MKNFFDKYELYTDNDSKYCYPNSFVLINKLNIKDFNTLKSAEADFVSARLFELENQSIKGYFDKNHLYEIHKYLFQDLYDFAGMTRDEDIAKGDTKFCVHNFIEEQLFEFFDKINKINVQKNTSKAEKIDFLAYVMAELNIIHPFREGNGRAIREFVREYAQALDLTIQWNKINKEVLLDAMVESVFDTTVLKEILAKILN